MKYLVYDEKGTVTTSFSKINNTKTLFSMSLHSKNMKKI